MHNTVFVLSILLLFVGIAFSEEAVVQGNGQPGHLIERFKMKIKDEQNPHRRSRYIKKMVGMAQQFIETNKGRMEARKQQIEGQKSRYNGHASKINKIINGMDEIQRQIDILE